MNWLGRKVVSWWRAAMATRDERKKLTVGDPPWKHGFLIGMMLGYSIGVLLTGSVFQIERIANPFMTTALIVIILILAYWSAIYERSYFASVNEKEKELRKEIFESLE
jgi:hypothetical protein